MLAPSKEKYFVMNRNIKRMKVLFYGRVIIQTTSFLKHTAGLLPLLKQRAVCSFDFLFGKGDCEGVIFL